jgi:hypothetical protein
MRTLAMKESRHRCDINLAALKDEQDESTRQPHQGLFRNRRNPGPLR